MPMELVYCFPFGISAARSPPGHTDPNTSQTIVTVNILGITLVLLYQAK
jgi:hypothetical protein